MVEGGEGSLSSGMSSESEDSCSEPSLKISIVLLLSFSNSSSESARVERISGMESVALETLHLRFLVAGDMLDYEDEEEQERNTKCAQTQLLYVEIKFLRNCHPHFKEL